MKTFLLHRLIFLLFLTPYFSDAGEIVSPTSNGSTSSSKDRRCEPARSKLTKDIRSLSGMDDPKNSSGVFADWRNDQASNRLNPTAQEAIRLFAREKLTDAVRDTKTVFYPFGGPDVLYPAVLFPKMSTLILTGLEEPGSLFEVPADSAKNSDFSRHVGELKRAYWTLFNWGYFVTSYMSKDLEKIGTTTMIATGLALTCNEITEIQAIRLDPEGHAIAAKPGEPPMGVRISYTSPEGMPRTVYYFKQDVSNGNLSTPFVKFFERQRIDTSFYKAAMYAPQSRKSFSRINEMAQTAHYIVQGDSGLPIDDLQKNHKWRIRLFGQYAPPNEQFKVKPQEELKTAFANAICKSGEDGDKERFTKIWQTDPCKIKRSPHANIVQYQGALPFRFDYGGTIPPAIELDFTSNLIYATRENDK